jgi:hypothetical protein
LVTQDHPDAIAYRRTADAFRARDFDLVETLISPEVVWHVCAISTMGARRDNLDVQTRFVSVFRYRDGDRSSDGCSPTTSPPGTQSSRPDRAR